MKIDCDVLNGKYSLKSFRFSKEIDSTREVLANAEAVPLGDQEFILRGLSSYDVVSSTSLINEALNQL